MKRIERVLVRLDIPYTLIGEELWAPCPFHEDTNPSWSIRRSGKAAGLHHCFSCGADGNLEGLVAHVRDSSLPHARAWLESLDEEAPLGARNDVPVIGARHAPAMGPPFRLPPEVSFRPLAAWPGPARDYAVERGLTALQVERWGIGYAASGRLAGRLVLVVRDASGAPRSYMARTFAGEKRYLYPRIEERPQLDIIFGEQHWKERERVVVTEGALDALAVERATGANVAALGGAIPRPLHAAKMGTFASVVLLTDADAAGDAAAKKLAAALGRRAEIARVRLRPGTDACSISKQELQEALSSSTIATPRHNETR